MKKALLLLLSVSLLLIAFSGCNQTVKPNPESDFEYSVKDDGSIEITKYIGETDHVVIPKKIEGKAVTTIGSVCFSGLNIVSLVMPNTIIYISGRAFVGCENLKEITLSSSLVTIGQGAFINCNSITDIDLSMDSLKYIDQEAFLGCQSLRTVKFGSNIELISDKAFYECVSLEEIILPKKLHELGQYAFGNCTNVRKIWIPKTLEKWGWTPFIGNSSVTEISFEDGLKKIGSYGAFAGCQVETLKIPASVDSIADIAFTAFPNLKEVYFDGNAPTVSANGGLVFATPEQEVKIYYNPSTSGWDTTPLRTLYTLISLSER